MKNRALKYAFYSLILSVVVSLAASGVALADYINGYFQYSLDNGSITIIRYTGKEETVTVPNLIAGDPVNVIGSGAFKDNQYVRTVRLPGSVIEIQEGAFGPSQVVEYVSSSSADNASQDATEQNGETASVFDSLSTGPLGVSLSDGTLVTVDYEGNLLLVDQEGVEYVLDDSKTYERETTPEGNVVIRDSDGAEVAIDAEAATVSFVNSEGSQGKFDANLGTTEITDESGFSYTKDTFGTMTAEGDSIELEQSAAGEASASSNAANSDQAQASAQTPVIVALVVVVVAVVAILLYRLRAKKARQEPEQEQEKDA